MNTTTDRPARARNAWAGIVFVVLYAVGFGMATTFPEKSNDVNDNPAKLASVWRDFYNDSGNRTTILIGAFILTAAALAFVVFGSALRDRLAAAGAPTAGRLAFAGSILLAASTLAGAAAMAWIPGSKSLGDVAVPTGEINYLSSQLAYALMLLGGGAAVGLTLVSAGVAGARSRALPGWLGWAGAVIGVLAFVFGVYFLPMILFGIWVLVATIVMLRRPVPPAPSPEPAGEGNAVTD